MSCVPRLRSSFITRSQNFAPCALLDPKPQDFLVAGGANADRQIHGLGVAEGADNRVPRSARQRPTRPTSLQMIDESDIVVCGVRSPSAKAR